MRKGLFKIPSNKKYRSSIWGLFIFSIPTLWPVFAGARVVMDFIAKASSDNWFALFITLPVGLFFYWYGISRFQWKNPALIVNEKGIYYLTFNIYIPWHLVSEIGGLNECVICCNKLIERKRQIEWFRMKPYYTKNNITVYYINTMFVAFDSSELQLTITLFYRQYLNQQREVSLQNQ